MSPILLLVAGALLSSDITIVEPAKILLLYPVQTVSHYMAYKPLIRELAKRGHEITAYTTIPGEKSDKNFQHTSINPNLSKLPTYEFETTVWRSRSVISFIHELWSYFPKVTEAALESKELQSLLQSEEKFDLMITEAHFMQESMLAFSHKFNVPVVTLHSVFVKPWIAQLIGMPHTFSYIPSTSLPYSDRMNFWQRTKNALIGMYEIVAGNFYYLPIQERMMREHFQYRGSENLPPLKQLISNISLVLVDSHQLMSPVRPYAPHVIDIAGMHVASAGKLPQDLQEFMDEATEGVIYFSFGSFFQPQSLSKRFKDVLIETLKGVKQRVIMKWSNKIDVAPHILMRTWLPQLEILAHPNCKLFITHGGFNGLMETMSMGVPAIGIPFFSDQYRHADWYEERGVGLEVDYDTITVAEFTEKINRVIYTPSFKENAQQIAELCRDQPQSPLEKAVFWVEYVIRHKGAHHLKPASVKMPYYQYLLLDVMAFLTISIVLTVYIMYCLVFKINKFFTGTFYVSEGKKQK